jgi:hypothetical protein
MEAGVEKTDSENSNWKIVKTLHLFLPASDISTNTKHSPHLKDFTQF